MTTKAKRKVRKPRKNTLAWFYSYHGEKMVTLTLRHINSGECRKLAAWLIKASKYLEQMEEAR